jgi:hypothetical protein
MFLRTCEIPNIYLFVWACVEIHAEYFCFIFMCTSSYEISLVNIKKLLVNIYFISAQRVILYQAHVQKVMRNGLGHACVFVLMWRVFLLSHWVRHRNLYHVCCFTTSWCTQKKFQCKHWYFMYTEVSRIIDYFKNWL